MKLLSFTICSLPSLYSFVIMTVLLSGSVCSCCESSFTTAVANSGAILSPRAFVSVRVQQICFIFSATSCQPVTSQWGQFPAFAVFPSYQMVSLP